MLLPFKKILCPTDFSEPSQKGVAAAIELAEYFGAEVTLISVVTPVYPVAAPGVPASYKIGEFYEEMVEHTTRSLERIEKEAVPPGMRSQRIVARGNAADAIVQHAATEAVDVIVIATHGWTGWRKWVFGSVADQVVRFAPCPVLTISERPED